jgi:predicted alpha/beta hydrolase family esterase
MRLLTVPGIFDSGPTHWLTLWEQEPERRCRRFEPASFDEPDAWDWVAAVERGVAELGGTATAITTSVPLAPAHVTAGPPPS